MLSACLEYLVFSKASLHYKACLLFFFFFFASNYLEINIDFLRRLSQIPENGSSMLQNHKDTADVSFAFLIQSCAVVIGA